LYSLLGDSDWFNLTINGMNIWCVGNIRCCMLQHCRACSHVHEPCLMQLAFSRRVGLVIFAHVDSIAWSSNKCSYRCNCYQNGLLFHNKCSLVYSCFTVRCFPF
jgi:hypothetical protein